MNSVNEFVKNDNDTQENEGIDIFRNLSDAFKLAKKHKLSFFLTIVLTAVIVLVASIVTYHPVYETMATFSITPLVYSDSKNGISVYEFDYSSAYAEQMEKTFPFIIHSDNLRDIINYDLGTNAVYSIKATSISASNVFQVSVSSSSADVSNNVMTSFAKSFPKLSEYVFGDIRLNVLYSSGLAEHPSNQFSYLSRALFGAFLGFVVDFVVFFALAYFRETIVDKNDVRLRLNSRCLCELPASTSKRNSKTDDNGLLTLMTHSKYSDSVGLLKRRIKQSFVEGESVIGISSTDSFEGKTSLSFCLAESFSGSGDSVLLIDLDLKNRSLQTELLKDPNINNGAADYCNNNLTVENITYKYHENFDIIFTGEATSACNNAKFGELINSVKEKYDYVIVNLPASGEVREVAALASLCDEVVFAVKSAETSSSAIHRAIRNLLGNGNVNLLGFVLTECDSTTANYGYYSAYRRKYHYKKYGYYAQSYGNDEM